MCADTVGTKPAANGPSGTTRELPAASFPGPRNAAEDWTDTPPLPAKRDERLALDEVSASA
jgi:hypothetical protein